MGRIDREWAQKHACEQGSYTHLLSKSYWKFDAEV